MRTFLGVPVASSRRAYGNLYLGDKDGGQPFGEEDERLLATLAAFAASASENVHQLDADRDIAASRERERVSAVMLGPVIEAREARGRPTCREKDRRTV